MYTAVKAASPIIIVAVINVHVRVRKPVAVINRVLHSRDNEQKDIFRETRRVHKSLEDGSPARVILSKIGQRGKGEAAN